MDSHSAILLLSAALAALLGWIALSTLGFLMSPLFFLASGFLLGRVKFKAPSIIGGAPP